MALPARFACYDSLLDYLVEQLVAEMLEGTDVEMPTGGRTPAGASHFHDHERSGGHPNHANGKPRRPRAAR